MVEDNGPDEEESLFGELFLNQSYRINELVWGEGEKALSLQLQVCTAACTDHDLTGQLLWPGAHILCSFIDSLPATSFLCHPNCSPATASASLTLPVSAVELGAGCGLAGLLFAARGGRVVLTDCNPVVMSLLARNVEGNSCALGGRAAAAVLEWGDATAAAALLAAEAAASAASPAAPAASAADAGSGSPGGGFELLLGADIIYPGSQAYLPGLISSLRALLLRPGARRRPGGGRLWLSYCTRAATTDRCMAEALRGGGFAVAEIPGTRRAVGGAEGAVMEVTWAEAGEAGVSAEAAAAAAEWDRKWSATRQGADGADDGEPPPVPPAPLLAHIAHVAHRTGQVGPLPQAAQLASVAAV